MFNNDVDYFKLGASITVESPDETINSDHCLKNVGKAFVGGLDEIKKLEVINYTFKSDKSKNPRVGVIAQDLQKSSLMPLQKEMTDS